MTGSVFTIQRPCAIVTGGSSGIGASLAVALASLGWVVGVPSRRPPSTWDLGPIPPGTAAPSWIEADLASRDAGLAPIRSWLSATGYPLTSLIHCAVSYGQPGRHPWRDHERNEWDEMFAINVRSQFLLTKGLVDILDTSRTSTVVAITSEAAEEVSVGRVAYSASKAASRSLFATLAAEGVSAAVVFQVRPGEVIATPGVRRRRPQNFDFGRYGDPTLFARRVVDQIVNADRTLSGRIVVLSGT